MIKKRMHYTIFNTPVLRHLLRGISLVIMKALGWKKSGALPELPQYVMIVAPHTSNWDFLYGAITAFALKFDVYFMAKHQLFRFPFGPLMRWLGGISIDRRKSGNTVDHTIDMFKKYDRLVVAIPPEGTRSKVDNWKTGFYYIAAGAAVPILMAFIDYGKKTAGVGPLLYPTGDIECDMLSIRNFYNGIAGRYRDQTALPEVERGEIKKCS